MATAGRDREVDALSALLEDGEGTTSVLLLEGEAGIGKTTLWRAGVAAAAERGHRVLSCAATQAEAQLSFTALRDLLHGAFDEVEDELPAPQRQALAVTLLRDPPRGPPPDQGAIGVALLTTLRALAKRAPVLVAVDDVQWLDPASESSLRFALRRLAAEPLHALLARRADRAEPLPLGLDRIEADRVQVVRLGSLTVGALGHILHTQLDLVYPRPTLQRIHQVSGGNPFFALELARALGDRAEPLGVDVSLPVPHTLHELVDERLTALPPETRDALVVASALARPTLDQIGAALGENSVALLAPAVDSNLVEVETATVRFRHPLFAAAVYDLVDESRRREIHRLLAGIVPDPEERARHLALVTSDPNEAVASIVELGASAAFARGSPAAAAALAAEALRLTPASGEDAARRRALAEVDYEFAAGDTATASSLLEELLLRTGPGLERARLLSRQARIQHFRADISSSVALLYEAREEAGDDAELHGEIEEGLAWGLLLVRRDLDQAASHARSAARLAEGRSAPGALAEALAAQAITELALGEPWRETMERALALEGSTLELRVLRHPTFALGYCLSCADELDAARGCFEELLRRATERGDEGSVPSIRNHLTLVECLSGAWAEAVEHAEDGFERALESGQRPTQASILAKLALVEARRGRLDDARETALRALAIAGDGSRVRPEEAPTSGGETAIWVLGLVELGAGQAETAHECLGPMCEVLLNAGVREPGEIRCLPDEIEALTMLGLLDEADSHTQRLEEWAERLGRPSARASALRCRGLVLSARGDVGEAIAALEDAVAASENSLLPFERGRALLALGSEQRRARRRRDARETLEAALATFDRLGAELLVEQTRSELRRIGGRAPSGGGLTPTEQRVAELVAEGKSNKEVAAVLVVSVHTVEAALTSIYRKLDVRSRTELARKLTEPGKH